MHAPRWLFAVALALFVAARPGQAEAQAFKPRGQAAPAKSGTKRKPATKAKRSKKAKTPSTKATARSAKTTQASQASAASARPKDARAGAQDAPVRRRPAAPEDADDYVLIEDDPI